MPYGKKIQAEIILFISGVNDEIKNPLDKSTEIVDFYDKTLKSFIKEDEKKNRIIDIRGLIKHLWKKRKIKEKNAIILGKENSYYYVPITLINKRFSSSGLNKTLDLLVDRGLLRKSKTPFRKSKKNTKSQKDSDKNIYSIPFGLEPFEKIIDFMKEQKKLFEFMQTNFVLEEGGVWAVNKSMEKFAFAYLPKEGIFFEKAIEQELNLKGKIFEPVKATGEFKEIKSVISERNPVKSLLIGLASSPTFVELIFDDKTYTENSNLISELEGVILSKRNVPPLDMILISCQIVDLMKGRLNKKYLEFIGSDFELFRNAIVFDYLRVMEDSGLVMMNKKQGGKKRKS